MGKLVADVGLGMPEITLKDNSPEVMREFYEAVEMALEAIGLKAEDYAKKEITNFPAVDTGRLRNSITYATKATQNRDFSYKDNAGTEFIDHVGKGAEENAVYIGTNVEYAPYIEMGTGIYAEDEDGTPNGEGRPDPWVYQDDNGRQRRTGGHKPVHFLKKAASEHTDEYKEIIRKILENI